MVKTNKKKKRCQQLPAADNERGNSKFTLTGMNEWMNWGGWVDIIWSAASGCISLSLKLSLLVTLGVWVSNGPITWPTDCNLYLAVFFQAHHHISLECGLILYWVWNLSLSPNSFAHFILTRQRWIQFTAAVCGAVQALVAVKEAHCMAN